MVVIFFSEDSEVSVRGVVVGHAVFGVVSQTHAYHLQQEVGHSVQLAREH